MCSGIKGSRTINVQWVNNQGTIDTEKLSGYIFIDNSNNTVEFRLCLHIDFSSYDDVRIFYKEGPGYAVWKDINQIKGLVSAQKIWNERLITPFLEYVSSL